MSQPRIKIPDNHQKVLLEFFKLDSEKRNAILGLINSEEIVGYGVDALVEELSKKLTIEEIDYTSLIDVFYSICRTKISFGLDDLVFINQISDYLERQNILITEEQKDSIRNILNSKITITAKSINLFLDVDKTYLESKIITDIRPVFSSEKEITLIGNLITYGLRIEYRDNDGTNRTIHLSLDSDDLSKLKEQIFRAEEKKKIIQSNYSNIIDLKV